MVRLQRVWATQPTAAVHDGFEIQQTNPATTPAPITRSVAWPSQRNSDGKSTKMRISAPSVNRTRTRTGTLPGEYAGRLALPSLANGRAILEHTVPMYSLSAFPAAFRAIPAINSKAGGWDNEEPNGRPDLEGLQPGFPTLAPVPEISSGHLNRLVSRLIHNLPFRSWRDCCTGGAARSK